MTNFVLKIWVLGQAIKLSRNNIESDDPIITSIFKALCQNDSAFPYNDISLLTKKSF